MHSIEDLDVDSNEILNITLAKLNLFMDKYFGSLEVHAVRRLAVMKTLFCEGLREIAEYVLSNEQEVTSLFSCDELRRIVVARFEETSIRTEILKTIQSVY